MTILKTIENNQLRTFVDGNLIYTRFLVNGEEKVFDESAYNKYLTADWKDLKYINDKLFIVKAKLKMFKTEDGGRVTGFRSGYRPNHVFEYKDNQVLRTYIGDIQFEGQDLIEPGEEKNVTVRFLMVQPIEKYLNVGRKWWIHEGTRKIGEAEIINVEV